MHIDEVRTGAKTLLNQARVNPTSTDLWQGLIMFCAQIGGVFSHRTISSKPDQVTPGQVWKYRTEVWTYKISKIGDGSAYHRVPLFPENSYDGHAPFCKVDSLLTNPNWICVKEDESPIYPPTPTPMAR